MEFKLGCNYWASNAGTEMWKQWDEGSVQRDFQTLVQKGVKYLRVFPNWRDFQPVTPLFTCEGKLYEYRMGEGELPVNPYYLDSKMLERFSRFCDLAEQYGIKLIVGIVTGWMSGRLFVPTALFGRNLFTDTKALLLEQKYVEGFVKALREKKAIYAWDLGNECNCMGEAPDSEAAENWTMLIANTIRANDNTRQIFSGMHSLGVESVWKIQDQAAHTDVLTTHPYLRYVPHCSRDWYLSERSLLHATCETKYYSEIGKKPCMVEEIGTLGPGMCDRETEANYLKVNLFSNWIHGAEGLLWWCANEQLHLTTPPYSWNMMERELGLLDRDGQPKPVLEQMEKFSKWLSGLDFELPKAENDGVCIVTKGQDQWGIAYMSYLLGKQVNINLEFAYGGQELPEAEWYLLPSLKGCEWMPDERFRALKKRVKEGASLYISNDDVVIAEFTELTGMTICDTAQRRETGSFLLDGESIFYERDRTRRLRSSKAEVLAEDEKGNPVFTVYAYGKGKVYYLNFPLEKMLLDQEDISEKKQYKIYSHMFASKLNKHVVECENPYIGITHHHRGNQCYAAVINYSGNRIETAYRIKEGYAVKRMIRGSLEEILPFETVIAELEKADDER